jgi:hypothetical protein
MRNATTDRTARPQLEQLERRDTPAGNVSLSPFGGGLLLVGDAADNQLGVFQNASLDLVVYGLHGTTINGQSSVYVGRGIPAGLFVGLGNGKDHFEVFGLVTGNISINGGNDGDLISLANTWAAGNIGVVGGEGGDSIYLSGVFAGNVLGLDAANGHDFLRFHNSGGFNGTFAINFEQNV